MCRVAAEKAKALGLDLNIRENLAEGGIHSFNIFNPQPFFQAQQMNTKDTDYSMLRELFWPIRIYS